MYNFEPQWRPLHLSFDFKDGTSPSSPSNRRGIFLAETVSRGSYRSIGQIFRSSYRPRSYIRRVRANGRAATHRLAPSSLAAAAVPAFPTIATIDMIIIYTYVFEIAADWN